MGLQKMPRVSQSARSRHARRSRLETLVLYERSVPFPIAGQHQDQGRTFMACPMFSRRSHLVGRQAVPPHGKVYAVTIECV